MLRMSDVKAEAERAGVARDPRALYSVTNATELEALQAAFRPQAFSGDELRRAACALERLSVWKPPLGARRGLSRQRVFEWRALLPGENVYEVLYEDLIGPRGDDALRAAAPHSA